MYLLVFHTQLKVLMIITGHLPCHLFACGVLSSFPYFK